MNYVIKGYDALPIRFFEEISAIPRATGNESGIADYLEDFARAHSLDCYRDAANNVFIKKAATPGREGESALLLQAHTDMVAEKNEATVHDFQKDPLRLIQEGNILHADGTTLGADDGYGVAMMLAALCAPNLSHPALECLFTASEEGGLNGALAFDYSHISAKRMLNLDSAEEDRIIVGCCGGHRTTLSFELHERAASGEGVCIRISGLCGGHSGEDIHRGRGNALMLLRQMLGDLQKAQDFCIADIRCVGRGNVIPRECEATLAVGDLPAALSLLQESAARIQNMPRPNEDSGLVIEVKKAPYRTLWSAEDTARMLHLLSTPAGVLEWREVGVLPHFSRNMACIRREGALVHLIFTSRSPSTETLSQSDAELAAWAARVGATCRRTSAYTGWESDRNSPFVREWQNAYRDTVGGELAVTVIHAGLECGVICGAVPGLEAIAIGPNIHDLHSPKEAIELDSFDRVWQAMCRFLAGE